MFDSLWGIKDKKMKIALISLLFILSSITSFVMAEDRIDSLIQLVLKQDVEAVKETDLIGQWTKYEGFSTRLLNFKEGKVFSLSTIKCLGTDKGPEGNWTLDNYGIRLWVKNQPEQIYVTRIESQIYLWTEQELSIIRARIAYN
jgi:hypothetical protein